MATCSRCWRTTCVCEAQLQQQDLTYKCNQSCGKVVSAYNMSPLIVMPLITDFPSTFALPLRFYIADVDGLQGLMTHLKEVQRVPAVVVQAEFGA